VLSLGY